MSAGVPKRGGRGGGKGGTGTHLARSPSVVSIHAGGAVRPDGLASGNPSGSARHLGGGGRGGRKKSRALDMRFSIASVGHNAAQPSLASFHSPRESRLAGAAATLAVGDQMRALIVPFVRNLTLESYKKTAAAMVDVEAAAGAGGGSEGDVAAAAASAVPPPRTVKGLAIEGRSHFVEEEARQLGILTGYGSGSGGSRPDSGEFASQAQGGVPASPAIQRVRSGGFFSLDAARLSSPARTPAGGGHRDESSDSNDDDDNDAEVAALGVPKRKFTGLAVRSKGHCLHVVPGADDPPTHHHHHPPHQAFAEHHIFIPVVRELK